jgi:hypothetical protein
VTTGIAEFGEKAIGRTANAIATFDDFATQLPLLKNKISECSISVANPSCSRSTATTEN